MPPARKPKSAKPPAAKAKADGPARIFLVYGDDDLSATRKADEIVNRLCPAEEQAFGLETFDPDPDLNADAVSAFLRNVMEALLTPPFLGGAKTVYVRNAPFFNPMVEPGKFASVKAETERLVELLRAGLPEGMHLVLLTKSVHRATAFYKTFDSGGEVHAFDTPERETDAQEDFFPRIEALLKERKLDMPRDVLSVFTDRIGFNLRQATMEIDKLSLYLGDRTRVTTEDIYQMVPAIREGKFWEFADAFCEGNLANTLGVMNRLLGQGESSVGMVVSLQNRLREMLILSDCLKRGWARLSGGDRWRKLDWAVPPEGEAVLAAMEKDPRKGHPFALAKNAAKASRFPPGRWFRWLTAAVDAQAAMTGGDNIDADLALEMFTTRTLGELAVEKSRR